MKKLFLTLLSLLSITQLNASASTATGVPVEFHSTNVIQQSINPNNNGTNELNRCGYHALFNAVRFQSLCIGYTANLTPEQRAVTLQNSLSDHAAKPSIPATIERWGELVVAYRLNHQNPIILGKDALYLGDLDGQEINEIIQGGVVDPNSLSSRCADGRLIIFGSFTEFEGCANALFDYDTMQYAFLALQAGRPVGVCLCLAERDKGSQHWVALGLQYVNNVVHVFTMDSQHTTYTDELTLDANGNPIEITPGNFQTHQVVQKNAHFTPTLLKRIKLTIQDMIDIPDLKEHYIYNRLKNISDAEIPALIRQFPNKETFITNLQIRLAEQQQATSSSSNNTRAAGSASSSSATNGITPQITTTSAQPVTQKQSAGSSSGSSNNTRAASSTTDSSATKNTTLQTTTTSAQPEKQETRQASNNTPNPQPSSAGTNGWFSWIAAIFGTTPQPQATTPSTVVTPTPSNLQKQTRKDDADEEPSGDANKHRRTTTNVVEEIMLRQIDLGTTALNGWECGFYAIFHYIASKNNYDSSDKTALRERYNQFINDLPTNVIDPHAKEQESSSVVNFKQLHDAKTHLNDVRVALLLHYLSGSPITAETEINFRSDDYYVAGFATIQDAEFYSPPSWKQSTINVLKKRTHPFWVLVCMAGHWVCLKFSPNADAVICYDSYINYLAVLKSYPAFGQLVEFFSNPTTTSLR